ncbi:MAG: hypothetical protein HY506_01395 [Candidatus Yanofskybacteria bacterium]|nr:hypothetical protein [Candidatus Yanofskybacteria bacterium]
MIIAIVFFLILAGIAFLIYRGSRPPTPPPTPNPTVNLAPIEIISSNLFNIQSLDYDFWAQVRNPNVDFGSGNASYEISFFNSAGTVISKKSGSFYILPGQTRYLVDGPIKSTETISRAQIKILSVDWQKLSQLGTIGVPLLVRGASYVEVLQPGIFSKVGGNIFNSSDFDINKADVIVVLLGQSDKPVAVGRTEIRTFLAQTTRGFEISWFSPFVGKVIRIQAEAYTNIFENLNFLRTYGGGEKFKQLY